MLTTTEPIRGRTYDDGIEMPAVHVLYEATKGTGKKKVPFQCDFQGPPLPMALVMDLALLKPITYSAI